MPIISGNDDLFVFGAVVELLVGVSASREAMLRRSGFAVPARARIRAQIDTGSSISVIHPDILRERLDIKPFDKIAVHAVALENATQMFDQYLVSLSLPTEEMEMLIEGVAVLSGFFGTDDDIQALLGRDVLEHCLFVYDGPRPIFSLAF